MPKVPYPYEVNDKLVTGNGSLILIHSLSNRSLLPSLTVIQIRTNYWNILDIHNCKKTVWGQLCPWIRGVTRILAPFPSDAAVPFLKTGSCDSNVQTSWSQITKGQTNSKLFFQAEVSFKKRTNKFDFTMCLSTCFCSFF